MSTADIKKTAETKMGRSIDAFKADLQKIRTGRAHPGMLDQIHVDYYASPVPLPALTEERRKDLTKVVRSQGEDSKVAIRNLRREANEHGKRLLKDKEITEDDDRRLTDDIQKLTDRTITEIDKLVQGKEAEILAV
jgi:ribosome recycling factor